MRLPRQPGSRRSPRRWWEGAVSRGMPSGALWRRARDRQRIRASRVVRGAGAGRGGALASAVTALRSISAYRDAGYGGRSPKALVRPMVRPAVDSSVLPVRSRNGGVWCEPGSNAIHLRGGLYSLAGCDRLQCGYFTLTVHFHKIGKPESSCERSLEGRYHQMIVADDVGRRQLARRASWRFPDSASRTTSSLLRGG